MPKKVLIVDDDAVDRILLSRWTQEKYPEALIVTENSVVPGHENVDLVVVDLQLSHSNGLSTVEEAKKHYPEAQLVVVSGLETHPEVKNLIPKERDSYEKALPPVIPSFEGIKPVSDGELNRVIASFERSIESLSKIVSKQNITIAEMTQRIVVLEAAVRSSTVDIKKVDEAIRGNGHKGLATKVELLSDKILKIEAQIPSGFHSSSKKEKYTIYAAIGSGAIGGLYSIISQLF